MTKRMLIDSTNAEETRVVVLDGSRLEEFDVETTTKHQLKGNVYLAKVVRVEPSLQAAFVEYGGNRHGFLAFGEIHPDYYQIPVADRKRLIEAQEQEARDEEERADREEASGHRGSRDEAGADDEPDEGDEPDAATSDRTIAIETLPAEPPREVATDAEAVAPPIAAEPDPAVPAPEQIVEPPPLDATMLVTPVEAAALFPAAAEIANEEEPGADMAPEASEPGREQALEMRAESLSGEIADAETSIAGDAEPQADEQAAEFEPEGPAPESIGGELDTEDHPARRATPRFLRHYKIQEVIRRRQILLVQVVKEERGSKGAALTTYISLAGRFSVLMPNSPRGGGISRKITSAADRRRLKEVTAELDLPRGMGLIVRTAGANRPKPEILRDCEYLLNQWDQVRDLTMKSMAPALIYEEASLIKRAIRDVYSRDVDDILVDGETGWRAARDFMRMLMPTHARKVQLWKDPQPLFAKAQVEQQLEGMLAPTVQLRSGGYLVINQTEALVAIDVNSGRSTRERGIEETALRTNMEAAEEAARQLRLRDLAGLIVIDFIDMENRRNVASVERRLKDALKQDRARIQVGGISHFGLLEMSRQRLRPSLTETNFTICAHCGGTGHMRSTESAALAALRAIEEEGGKRRAAEIVVHCPSSVALYILNNKRQRLTEIENRHGMVVSFVADDSLLPPALRIEKIRAQTASELPVPVQQLAPPEPFEDPDEIEAEAEANEQEAVEAAPAGETREERDAGRGRRRRRRGRTGRRDEAGPAAASEAGDEAGGEAGSDEPGDEAGDELDAAESEDETAGGETAGSQTVTGELETAESAVGGEESERRRRGRRGGRRRRREGADGAPGGAGEAVEEGEAEPIAAAPAYVPPSYAGPTPANPFGGTSAFDIFDAIEQAEAERALAPRVAVEPQAPVERPVAALMAEPVAVAAEAEVASAVEPEPEPVVEAEAEAVAGPVIQPVLVGSESPSAERRRGWWRR